MVRKPFYGMLLILLVALVGVIGAAQAQGQPGSPFTKPIMYEAVLANDSSAEVQWASLEAQLPPGSAYVGLAAGSQVGTEPQRLGDLLIWEGPFNVPPDGELLLRYWLAPTDPGLESPSMLVTAQTADSVAVQTPARIAEPISPEISVPEDVASPEAVTVDKRAEDPTLEPGDEPWVAYEVTFTNDSPSPATLDSISDTMADGFEFVGMAYGSEVEAGPDKPDERTLVWQGPFLVPGDGSLVLRYWVKAVETIGDYENSVEASSDGVTIGPDTATVSVVRPILSVAKDASALEVTVAQPVTYDVTISNSGNYTGFVEVISDTLPPGFSFLEMDPNSDIQEPSPPPGTEGTIVWDTMVEVPDGDEIHLIYKVRAGKVGAQSNSVEARDDTDQVIGPAGVEIEVLPAKVFVPLVQKAYSITPPAPPGLPIEEDFMAKNIPPEWTPFVNYPELFAGDWFHEGDGVNWGRYTFNAGEPLAQYALSMYLAEGSEDWTDYRIEVTLRADKAFGKLSKLVGIWFRGTHELRKDNKGGNVTGYMFLLKPDDRTTHSKAYLGHIDPDTRKLGFLVDRERRFPNVDNTWYDVTIEVSGNNIKVWVGPTYSLASTPTLVYDWTDSKATWGLGTVGFVVYQGAASFDSIRVTPLD